MNRGDRVALFHRHPERFTLMAFVWLDRDRRYFVATCSSMSPGTPYSRTRLRQVAAGDEDPERVELEVPQPKAAEVYYSG